ncbi:MAG TPA: tetratricopeptide repeat protein [Candidatus Obscuribacterales bacterium]
MWKKLLLPTAVLWTVVLCFERSMEPSGIDQDRTSAATRRGIQAQVKSLAEDLKSAKDKHDGQLVQRSHWGLAQAYWQLNRLDLADAHIRQFLTGRESSIGVGNPGLLDGLRAAAGIARDRGKFDEAKRYYRRALAIAERAYGEGCPQAAADLDNLGVVCFLEALGQADRVQKQAALQQAARYIQSALDACWKAGPGSSSLQAVVLRNRSLLLTESGIQGKRTTRI